jgi:hypothetical protein
LFASASIAGQTWTFDVKTSGQNVTWTSPTAVDPAASVYAVNYTITKVLVDVTWLGIPFNGIDVTNQIPPAMQSAAFEVPGPAPVAALNQPVVIPPPPTAPAFAANLSFGLDANGFGYASATNVVLGTLAVNLGGIFGTQNVTLKAVRLIGNLTIHGAWFDLGHALAGSLGTPVLLGSGPLSSGSPLTLTLLNASPSSPTLFIVGLSTLNLPFHGGLMVPSVDLVIPLATDPTGSFSLPANWPAGIPANTSLYMQCWVLNPSGTAVDGASNALRAVAQ